jgi:cytochrome c peroxidase
MAIACSCPLTHIGRIPGGPLKTQSLRHKSKPKIAVLAVAAMLVLSGAGYERSHGGSHERSHETSTSLTPEQQLGKALFFDANLSTPRGQSCATCHGPAVGYTGPDQAINAKGAVYEGAVHGRFGNRKPPTAAYAGNSPILGYQSSTGWVGGMFWDGRATGKTLGDPLAEQAQGPFLNPLEQNNASAQVVIEKVLASKYKSLFSRVCDTTGKYYECIGRSIAAYERSGEVSKYTSKYDYALKGQAKLTGQEKQGLALFTGKAKCASCHTPGLFTDFTYDNLGVPKNPLNPFYREPRWNPLKNAWIDEGLGGYLKSVGDPAYALELGKQKVPTLRNVDLRPTEGFVKSYGHNGYFKSLEEIVHFYNTRDVDGARWHGVTWPAPEVATNINTTQMGNLKLTKGEEAAVVTFLKTLSDGYVPTK